MERCSRISRRSTPRPRRAILSRRTVGRSDAASRAGTSTTFLVLQRQLDVANQQLRELQAQTDLDKSIVELNRVSGGIFTQNGIDTSALGTTTLNAASSTQSSLPSPGPAVSAPPVTRHTEPVQRKPL